MLKIPFAVLGGCLLLAACGKSENTAEQPQNAAQSAPKPVFKVKYIDNTAIAGLALGQSSEGKTNDGKKQISYPIKGLPEQNAVRLTGKHPNDLEAVVGKCMETDGKDAPSGWAENGVCHTLFAKLVGNIAEDGGKLTDYLISHSALQPYQAGKSGYAAVQNGRYVLEIDSEGRFISAAAIIELFGHHGIYLDFSNLAEKVRAAGKLKRRGCVLQFSELFS